MSVISLVQFAALLTSVSNMAAGQREGLQRAAELVEEEAKDSLGTYQGASGPVPAWPTLSQVTQDDRVEKGFSPNEPLLRSGELRDSIDIEVHRDHAFVGSTHEGAPAHELGADGVPQRSFLAGAAYRNEEEIAELIGQAVFNHLFGDDL